VRFADLKLRPQIFRADTLSTRLTLPDSPQKSFALNVVQCLKDAGHDALWAGGCVRDALLGMPPKDFDVATSARPEQVVELFGKRRTIGVGASFGVIIVLGKRKSDGQIEVATFRSDGAYSDGRRPDSVEFCSAELDAQRRDFTINGIFFDPVDGKVIDYVGGQEDLKAGMIRAIGDPDARIAEDKLRMLRAVRFAARFGYELDPGTSSALTTHAADLDQVSVERIAEELRRMLSHPSRKIAVELMLTTGLLAQTLPEVSADNVADVLASMTQLGEAPFVLSMALLLGPSWNGSAAKATDRVASIRQICRQLKLSNAETDTICWLADSAGLVSAGTSLPKHVLKPMLSHLNIDSLLALLETRPESSEGYEQLLRVQQETPIDLLNPPPLIDGEDLKTLGVQAGPKFSRILKTIRDEQLDEILMTTDAALARARALHFDDVDS